MSSLKNILYGGDLGSDKEICGNAESLGEALFNRLQATGKKIVLVDGITDRKVSGVELLSKAIHLAQYLQQNLAIKSGDVISVCSENSIEFVITFHATLLIGATLAPLNHTYMNDEMEHAINISKPKLIFVSPQNLDQMIGVAQKNTFIEQIILYDDSNTNATHLTGNLHDKTFNQIMESEDATKINQFKCTPQNMKENVAYILCSSGTTGLPKGVQLTQFNALVVHAQDTAFQRPSELPPSGERIVLGHIPMFHAFGLTVCLSTILNGTAKIVLVPRFEATNFLHTIQSYKVTNLYAVPPMMIFFAKSPLVSEYDLSSLHMIQYGAAPISKEIVTMVKNRIGVKYIRQGYGMTEATCGTCVQYENHDTHGSVGILYKGIYGRVVDIEGGECLGPNRSGEIQFKCPNIMKGYIGDTQATSASIDADGWLHTGDIGYYDKNEEWYIVDRIKELIKYKGFQVPPAEIEATLLKNPQILDAGVVGVPNEEGGEAAFAFVVKQPGATITEKDVMQYIAERLSHPKRLHGGVKFLDAIPKNASGKILRRTLREMTKNLNSKL